ncbi:MAG: AMP-binding protein [Proteobacteria bacterium]|nr:AMP-binding protein [Pseudomonadota bacterium]
MNKPRSRTVPALLAEMVARDAAHLAIVDGEQRLSYAQFAAEVLRAARALHAVGVRAGDRVGILMGNRAEWLILDFATMSLGAITVGLNTWATAHELGYQLRHAQVKLLAIEPRFRNSDFRALLAEARAQADGLPALQTVVCTETPADDMMSYADLLRAADGVDAAVVATASAAIEPTDVACLLYTSGSTALPKGVPLLHGGLIDNMWEIGERQHLVADDKLWLSVSLFWSLACVNALYAVMTHGASIVLQHQFDAGEALLLIERERCTVFYGTPNMALALWEHPARARHDLSSLRTGVTIGTPEQLRRVAALGVEKICNVYGLTEAYGNSAVTDAELPLEQRVLTVGRPLGGVEIRISDGETCVPLPVNTAGEITIKGQRAAGLLERSGAYRRGFHRRRLFSYRRPGAHR